MTRKLSPETIRFRLWQLRRTEPELTQISAAREIGCSVEQLRAAQPRGWTRGGQPPGQHEHVEADQFMSNPEYYLRLHNIRGQFELVNWSLI